MSETRTITVDCVEDIREAERCIRCFLKAYKLDTDATPALIEHIDEAEFSLRKALARLGIDQPSLGVVDITDG